MTSRSNHPHCGARAARYSIQPPPTMPILHPCAMPCDRAVKEIGGWLIDDSETRTAVNGQSDHYRKLTVLIDELPSPVERIDDPDALRGQARGRICRFFREYRVGGETLPHMAQNEVVGGVVGGPGMRQPWILQGRSRKGRGSPFLQRGRRMKRPGSRLGDPSFEGRQTAVQRHRKNGIRDWEQKTGLEELWITDHVASNGNCRPPAQNDRRSGPERSPD